MQRNALSIDGLRDRDDVEERLLNLYDDCGEDEKLKVLEHRIKLKEEQRPSNPNQALCEKVGRNSPCPCGSVKKYKKCCGSY